MVLSLICGVSASTLQVVRVNLEPVIEKQNDYYVRGPALERLFDQPASNLLSNKIIFEVGEEQYPIFYTIKEGKLTDLAVERYEVLLEVLGKKMATSLNTELNDITDEFIKPIVMVDDNEKPIATIQEDDVIIFFNFRSKFSIYINKI